jgi:hypothetical protein
MDGLDWIGAIGQRRPGRNSGPTAFHGGAMIGKRQTSLSGIIQQTESTGRKNGTWWTHLGWNQGRGMDGGGGMLYRADGDGEVGFVLTVTGLSGSTAASRGWDGCGGVQHPTYIALEQFQERKEEIEARIRSVVNKERNPTPAWGGRRRPTRGPMASASAGKGRRRARPGGLLGSAQAKTRGRKGDGPRVGKGRPKRRLRRGSLGYDVNGPRRSARAELGQKAE